MKTAKSDQNKVKSLDPDSVLKKMSELLIRIQDLSVSKTMEADNQKLELSKEILRLSRSVKEFYKDKNAKHKKKMKDSKQAR
ncbi:MAG: hypothetical protein WAW07_14125 [Bacteroidales bacterium]